jgi:hypothetical protein
MFLGAKSPRRCRLPKVSLAWIRTGRFLGAWVCSPRGEAQEPVECCGVAVPVLGDDVGSGLVEDVSEDECRDDGVVEGAEDGDELGNEIDG